MRKIIAQTELVHVIVAKNKVMSNIRPDGFLGGFGQINEKINYVESGFK